MIGPIVSVDLVREYIADVVFCDVRYSLDTTDGHGDYLSGHLPGALYIDMETVLAAHGDPTDGRHPLPCAEDFAAALGSLGIGPNDLVVAYDAVGGRFAGRLVWMLRVLGQDAALLDGGLDAWVDAFGTDALATGEEQRSPVERPVVEWPSGAIVDADGVAEAIAAGARVYDSRDARRYRGEFEPIDAKAGHVPGAENLPFAANYADGGNYFEHRDVLRQRFAGTDDTTIFYCGSGVTACNNILAAEAAGFIRPRLYVGSWSGWSASDRPIATGDNQGA